MKRKLCLIVAVLIFVCSSVQARDLIDNYSPAQLAMGRTSLCAENTLFVIAANPALLCTTPRITGAICYQNFFELTGIYLFNGGASYNFGKLAGGLLISYYGDFKIFEERRFTLGLEYSPHKIFSLGINIDYSSITFDSRYEALDEFSFGIGMASFFEQFILHAVVTEINQPRLTGSDRRTKPGYRVGMHMNNNHNLVFNIEVSGRVEQDPQYHFGQEFRIEEHYFLRLGILTNPTQPSIGLGINWDNYTFHYGFNDNSDLGQTHSVGISVIL